MILAGDIGGTKTHLALFSSQAALERSDDRPSERSTCSSIYGAEAGNVGAPSLTLARCE